MAFQPEVLDQRFVRVKAAASGKEAWLCLKCAWQSVSKGAVRPLEHACFQSVLKHAEYVKWHSLGSRAEIPDEMEKFLKQYKMQGNCTSPCPHHLSQEEVLRLAECGERCATVWAQFARWLPLGWKPGASKPAVAPGQVDLREAQKKHVIALVCSSMSFACASSDTWKQFFGYAARHYVPPSASTVCRLVRQLDTEISQAVDTKLRQGTWFGATSLLGGWGCLQRGWRVPALGGDPRAVGSAECGVSESEACRSDFSHHISRWSMSRLSRKLQGGLEASAASTGRQRAAC